jgi:TldD protein
VHGEKQASRTPTTSRSTALDEAAVAARAIGRQGQSAVRRAPRSVRALALRARGSRCVAAGRAKGRVARAPRADGAARDPRVSQVMASLAGEYEAVLIARSDGMIAPTCARSCAYRSR